MEFLIDTYLELDSKAGWGSNDFLWAAGWIELRHHSRFQELLELYKFPEYWDQVGWPEFCERESEEVITCS